MKKLLILVLFAVLLIIYFTGNPSLKEINQSTSTSSSKRPGMGTTRDPEFQREYEETVRRYDQQMRGLPSNLVLPSGETVEERVRSGQVYGK